MHCVLQGGYRKTSNQTGFRRLRQEESILRFYLKTKTVILTVRALRYPAGEFKAYMESFSLKQLAECSLTCPKLGAPPPAPHRAGQWCA